MRKLRFLALVLAAGTFVASCNKGHEPNPDGHDSMLTPPTSEAYYQFREAAFQSQIKHISIDLDTIDGPPSFLSENGVSVRFSPSSLTINGQPVSGKIDISYLELFDAGAMLVTNKTTMGLDDQNRLVPIVTGGAFYINASKDGQDLDRQTMIFLEVPGALTGGVDPNMILWDGDVDNEGNLTWRTIGTGGNDRGLIMGDSVYSAVFENFGWTNIDRFINDNRPKTEFKVAVPNGFNNTNSLVYVKYKGEPNALARLDKYIDDEKLFSEHYGWMPIGQEVHLIFVSSRSDGKWLIGTRSITVEANKIYTISSNETQIVDDHATVANLINALP